MIGTGRGKKKNKTSKKIKRLNVLRTDYFSCSIPEDLHMVKMKGNPLIIAAALSVLAQKGYSFSIQRNDITRTQQSHSSKSVLTLSMSTSTAVGGFIETELRGKAMKLHTRSQAPKEGEAEEKKMEPYTPTRDDYLRFLVDSQHIYKAFEEVVDSLDGLSVFRNTGLERVKPLEEDIEFMVKEYNLQRPEVGKPGLDYADEIRRLGKEESIPEFMCHYYNFYFAHTAGGRMIGKQMSALLLDKKTLEFYKVGLQLRQFHHFDHQTTQLTFSAVGR